MRKFLLPLAVLLAGCGATSQYVKSVKPKDVASYRTIQESKVCWGSSCFLLAVLRGPDGNDYLMVDHRVGKQKGYWDYGLSLCNLTALKESIEKTGKGKCKARDQNMGVSGHPYIDNIDFYVFYGTSTLPFAKEYGIEVYSYRDAIHPGYVPWKASFNSHRIMHPVAGFIYGIEWNRGKIRAIAKEPKDGVVWKGDITGGEVFKGEFHGNWIDLTPYIPVQKAP